MARPSRVSAGPDRPPLRLSVLIITWNEAAKLERCLGSLAAALDVAQDEIVVVDNGSTDGTAERIAALGLPLVYRRLPANRGVAAARNVALAMARGRFVMVLDNDTCLLPGQGMLGSVIEALFARRPELGVVGFQLLNPDGSRQANARRFPSLLQPFAARLAVLRRIPALRREHERHLMTDVDFGAQAELEVDYVLGANQVFERALAAAIGGYDERIFYGPEDCEFCLRVRDAGRRVLHAQTIRIEHDYQRRTTGLANLRLLWAQIAGFARVFSKRRTLWRLAPRPAGPARLAAPAERPVPAAQRSG